MAIERTISILKPSAVRDNHIGAILAKFEAAGLRIVAAKMMKLSPEQAGRFTRSIASVRSSRNSSTS